MLPVLPSVERSLISGRISPLLFAADSRDDLCFEQAAVRLRYFPSVHSLGKRQPICKMQVYQVHVEITALSDDLAYPIVATLDRGRVTGESTGQPFLVAFMGNGLCLPKCRLLPLCGTESTARKYQAKNQYQQNNRFHVTMLYASGYQRI